MRNRYLGPPPPPPRRGSGIVGLVLVTAAAFLLAPHAKALRPQADALRAALAAGQLTLPAIRLPRLDTPPGRPGGPTSTRAARAVRFALDQRGKPYRWAAAGPHAYDCSGLTWAAWRSAGVTIPRTTAGQARLPRARGRLRPGDLLIYRSDGPTRRHVAIVAAPDAMVEALSRGVPVRSTRLRGGWLAAVRPGPA